jgi:hypothetical protein
MTADEKCFICGCDIDHIANSRMIYWDALYDYHLGHSKNKDKPKSGNTLIKVVCVKCADSGWD